MLDDSGVANCSPSEMSDLTDDFNRSTGMPLLESGRSISGDIKFSDMDTPVPDDSGVANHSLSEMPELACDFNRTTGTSFLGSGKLICGDPKFSDMDARCWTLPEWHTNRPRRCQTSQVTLIE